MSVTITEIKPRWHGHAEIILSDGRTMVPVRGSHEHYKVGDVWGAGIAAIQIENLDALKASNEALRVVPGYTQRFGAPAPEELELSPVQYSSPREGRDEAGSDAQWTPEATYTVVEKTASGDESPISISEVPYSVDQKASEAAPIEGEPAVEQPAGQDEAGTPSGTSDGPREEGQLGIEAT